MLTTILQCHLVGNENVYWFFIAFPHLSTRNAQTCTWFPSPAHGYTLAGQVARKQKILSDTPRPENPASTLCNSPQLPFGSADFHHLRVPSRNCLFLLARTSATCYLLYMSSEQKVLGRAIRAIRKAQGISLDTLAIDTIISPSHLHRIETGERQPSFEHLDVICARLGISTADVTYPVETLILVSEAAHTKHLRTDRRVLVAA